MTGGIYRAPSLCQTIGLCVVSVDAHDSRKDGSSLRAVFGLALPSRSKTVSSIQSVLKKCAPDELALKWGLLDRHFSSEEAEAERG